MHPDPLLAHASPSTLYASPLPTPQSAPAINGNGPGNSNPNGNAQAAVRRSAESNRPRSSIACTSCRRSKVKCANAGTHTTCLACQKNGRQCTYPISGADGDLAAASQRRESMNGAPDRMIEMPRKRRKIAPTATAPKDNVQAGGDLLDSQLLTPQVCLDLYAIFEQHFATDLPFLHKITFCAQLRQMNVHSLEEPFACLLLAFLALTTPYHEVFVRRSKDSARRYADAARTRLFNSGGLGDPTMETIQTLLMLGLHEWRSSQGKKCFLTIGMAINLAVQEGYDLQDDLADKHAVCPPEPETKPKESLPTDERFIKEEMQRRTFWSCFILDSYVSSGRYRPWMIQVEKIKIQLPCSELAFNFGLNVRARMLRETQSDFDSRRRNYEQSQVPDQDSSVEGSNGVGSSYNAARDRDVEVTWHDEDVQEGLAWFIKALDVYRGVMHWTCNVTRRHETLAPYDERSEFFNLDRRLKELKRRLRMDLTLSQSKTAAQLGSGTSRNYVLLHSIFAICDIALHREYLAFLPFGYAKPEGPIDGPVVPDQRDHAEYWVDSARTCFKAAREFLDLMWTCKKQDRLVETPMTGFTMWYVLQTLIWCCYFPKMDQSGYLCTNATRNDTLLASNIDRTWTILTYMQERLPMARPWLGFAPKYLGVLKKAKKTHLEAFGSDSPDTNISNSSDERRSDGGPGLVDYIRLEKRLKEFGDHQRNEDNNTAADVKPTLNVQQDLDDESEAGSPAAVKSEDSETIEGTPDESRPIPSNSWKSVNGNGSVQSDSDVGTPKLANKHTEGFEPVSRPLDQALQRRTYNYAFAPPANGMHNLPPPPAYQPTESAQRDTLHPSQQAAYQNLGNIAAPSTASQTQAQRQAVWNDEFGAVDWGHSDFSYSFARGNDVDNELWMNMAPQGAIYQGNMVQYPDHAMQQAQQPLPSAGGGIPTRPPHALGH